MNHSTKFHQLDLDETYLRWSHPTWEVEVQKEDEDDSSDLLQDTSNMFGSGDIESDDNGEDSIDLSIDEEKCGEMNDN